MNDGLPQWLKDILDTTTGTFKRIADFELEKKGLEIARDIQVFRDAEAAEQQAARASVVGGSLFGGIDLTTVLIFGGLLLGGVLLLRR